MPRRRRAEIREVAPDAVYNSTLVEKFVNSLMWQGKKNTAQGIFYDAMEKIKERSGTWFDPAVIEILDRRFAELEHLSQTSEEFSLRDLSKDVRVDHGLEPALGLENGAELGAPMESTDFLSSIASARQEAQTMFELSQDLGVSLSLSETLSVLSMRLRKMIDRKSTRLNSSHVD